MELSTAYSGFVTSVLGNMEKLLVDIDQNGIIITDESTVTSFRNIGRTMQRLLSKWDKSKPPTDVRITKNTLTPEERSPEISPNQSQPETVKSSLSLFHESFLYDTETPKKFKIDKENLISTDQQTEIKLKVDKENSVCNEEDAKKMKLSFDEIMRKRSKEDIDDSSEDENETKIRTPTKARPSRSLSCTNTKNVEEEWLNDKALKKISSQTFLCKLCSIELNKNNVQSHLNGKQHKNRSVSLEKDTDDVKFFELEKSDSLAIETVRIGLRVNKEGKDYIVLHKNSLTKCYFCNLCKIQIPRFNNNLIQHLTGQQHKRLCDTD